MRITVKQRGGFAGVDVDLANVDTAALDATTRTALEQQVRAVLSSASVGDPAVGADQLEYEITVEDGSSRKVKTWLDDGSGAATPVRELVARLTDVR